MFSLRSLLHSLPSCTGRVLAAPVRLQTSVLPLSTSTQRSDENVGSTWRLPRYDGNANAVWPNYQKHYTHHKYKMSPHNKEIITVILFFQAPKTTALAHLGHHEVDTDERGGQLKHREEGHG